MADNTKRSIHPSASQGVNNPEHARTVTKLFFLLSLNASDEISLFRRLDLNLITTVILTPSPTMYCLNYCCNKNVSPRYKFTICTGAGLRLMNTDSRICEYVIADFKTDTPILTVHDSFIVPFGEEIDFTR